MIARYSTGGPVSGSDSRDRYQRLPQNLHVMTWRKYHESTKHSVESLRRTRHALDWANMPDPFRHYEGVPVLDLPADPSPPETPVLDVLEGGAGRWPAHTGVAGQRPAPRSGPAFLSQLLFFSAAISASK